MEREPTQEMENMATFVTAKFENHSKFFQGWIKAVYSGANSPLLAFIFSTRNNNAYSYPGE